MSPDRLRFTALAAALGFVAVLADCASSSSDPPGGRAGAAASSGGNAGAAISAAGAAGFPARGGSTGNSAGASNAGGTAGSVVEIEAGAAGAAGSGPDGGEWPGPAGWPANADLPYYPTNWDEPYRAQYHYTSPNGWLNDANGLWYYGGVYHLTFQTYPYTLTEGPKQWGHATSPDLIHWVTAPIALEPSHVPGDAWSGSTVIDLDNTSGLQTGKSPVLVTVYTATSVGTAIAYSNDLGLTWQAYSGNPLAIDGGDPHVFWYEPAQHWVCVTASSAGSRFFTSPDLKVWKQTGTSEFGLDCPDLYELPVDGVTSNTKWVLQRASGAYLVGQFDGNSFVADPGGPYNQDLGVGFYASQTYYRRTFPDPRTVQMAWINSNDLREPITAPFNQSLSFPVQLGLRTFPEGIRLTRSPIAEINELYGVTRHFGAQVLAANQNLLAGISAKTYDFELAVDVTKSTAKQIQFQLANKSFTYDIASRQLLGTALPTLSGAAPTLAPLNGIVTFRLLADWGQLELFGNDGELSYTRALGFTPEDASLSLSADGALALVSADFRALERAWPGVAALSSSQIDDADAATKYAGTWTNVADDRTYFESTCHVGSSAGTSVETTLTGTRFEWHGLKNDDLGKVAISVDGTVVLPSVDMYAPIRQIATIQIPTALAAGSHVVKVTVTGDKNPASNGTAMVHDFFESYVDAAP